MQENHFSRSARDFQVLSIHSEWYEFDQILSLTSFNNAFHMPFVSPYPDLQDMHVLYAHNVLLWQISSERAGPVIWDRQAKKHSSVEGRSVGIR